MICLYVPRRLVIGIGPCCRRSERARLQKIEFARSHESISARDVREPRKERVPLVVGCAYEPADRALGGWTSGINPAPQASQSASVARHLPATRAHNRPTSRAHTRANPDASSGLRCGGRTEQVRTRSPSRRLAQPHCRPGLAIRRWWGWHRSGHRLSGCALSAERRALSAGR